MFDSSSAATSSPFESLKLSVGGHCEPQAVARTLERFGYRRVPRVSEAGEYAIRGGILDLFPAAYELPLRIELAGHDIASMRSFNPLTTEFLEPHTHLVLLPRDLTPRGWVELPLAPFVDVRAGDYVVHLEYGIARYHGMTRLRTVTDEREAFLLEYADGDRLYVPTDQMHLIQKYVAFEGREPALSTLGTDRWQRIKARAWRGVWEYARELLDRQAKRAAYRGHACAADTDWQRAFEAEFPYRETADQLRSAGEVKRDMESPRPMDRLLLGDVGYGKTEVAMRAAFKAIMDHKQVAVLVPTTILAAQHFRTFGERMRRYPVNIQMLSRFTTERDAQGILRAVREGSCDLVIGTHRLLSPDVQFKDLGLVMIDEEQRFGVKHKEAFKQLRLLVDVLVLTATPIPRTLYLALVGARDLSLITTAPENRHPVETRIVLFHDDNVRRWLQRELARGGQVYVIHDHVQDIGLLARRLAALVPEARIAVAHGQMPDADLERVMVEFVTQRCDILVATTIIQSGIDIPNANTVLIHRADRFGLADLYQLRGRVGRFDRRAWCYLLLDPQTPVSAEARQRLQAVVDHHELGSGFHIAMEDLKLRGAGDLLGVEQHGHISAVGFDLYCRLLREAIAQLQRGVAPPSAPREGRTHAALPAMAAR